jgi:hypothetical protein
MTRTTQTSIAILSTLLLCGIPSAHASGTASVSIQLISSSSLAPGQTAAFAVNANGFTNPSYSLSDSFSGSSMSSGDISNVGYFSWVPTVYDAGEHQVTVNVSDIYGDAASSTINILVLSNTVLLQSLTPGNIAGANQPITFTAVAPGFINPYFTVHDSYTGTDITNSTINYSSGDFDWIPPANQQGTHILTVSVTDDYGHTASITQTITVTNPQLTVSSLSPSTSVAVGTPISFTAAMSGLATTTDFSVADNFSGTSTISTSDIASNGLFTWTPATSDVGTHLLTVSASDVFGNTASTTQKLIVTAAPTVTPITVVTPVVATSTASSSPSATTSSNNGYVFTKLLAIGSRGVAVTALQTRLTALGVYSGPVTGYFGTLTAAGVRKFQASEGLEQVGYLGPLTRAALNQ